MKQVTEDGTAKPAARKRKTDLSIGPLPAYTDVAGPELNQQLFRWLETITIETYTWYISEKSVKSRISKTIRVLAVVLLTAGGIFPLLALISDGEISGEWGFVALAIGAGALLLDRAFGFSASWTRYASAALELRAVLLSEQIQWAQKPEIESEQPAHERECISRLAKSLNEIVRGETATWAMDFEKNLVELESTIGSHPR